MSMPRRSWLSIATVAATFAFIVLALMLASYAQPVGENPFDSNEWQTLKSHLAEDPSDTEAAERARSLDLELRQAFFRRRQRIRTGGTLLLVALVVFLVAIKRANRRALPEPNAPESAPTGEERDRRSARASLAVIVVGILIAAGAALLWWDAPARVSPEEAQALVAEAPPAWPPSVEERARHWPSFRGHDGSGVSTSDSVPTAWDGATGAGILWMTPLPLPGNNSPVVWGDRVYLTGADARREEVYALDAATGALIWKKGLVVVGRRDETEEPMEDTGYAAPTAATDGRYVYVGFTSGRVAAFDLEGNQVWLRAFGSLDNTYGHSSSLALHDDRVLVQLDQGYTDDGLARLIALDATTGKTVWETPREVDTSWASPVVFQPATGPQVVLSATPFIAAYDPKSGAEIWRAEVMSGEVGPSPIGADGVVYAAQEDVGIYAVAAGGQGDVTESHVMWEVPDQAPDVTSPVCDGERVYMLTSSGTLSCIRAETGETLYQQDLGASYYSSPTIAGGTLFVTSMEGVTTRIALGDAYRELGKCALGEAVVASFAFAPGRIYLRGQKHLFAIGEGE